MGNQPAGGCIHHGDLYKLNVYWECGQGERIPAWATRVVQDEQTKIFSAQVWAPENPYKFKKKTFKPDTNPLLIYECHIGMAQQEEKVGTYNEFREKILPRIAEEGYNCIQIMRIHGIIHIMEASAIMYPVSLLPLRVLVPPMN